MPAETVREKNQKKADATADRCPAVERGGCTTDREARLSGKEECMNPRLVRRMSLTLASLVLAACASSPWQRTESGYWIAQDAMPPPVVLSSACFGAGFVGPWWPGHWRAGGFGPYGSCWPYAYHGSAHWFLVYGSHDRWYHRYPAYVPDALAWAQARSLGRSTRQSLGAGTPSYETLAPARGRDLGGSRIGHPAPGSSRSSSPPRAMAVPRASMTIRRQEE
jgi:hypothetical protein